MKIIFRSAVLGLSLACALSCTARATADATVGDNEKLTRMLQQSTLSLLKEGNARFLAGKTIHPNQEIERRAELASAGQEPIATILACSDSRDPVELIFDRGVGDLFVIRVAGNVAGVSELATMEYGVTHLGTPVLVVMGHSKCGAVTAVVQGATLHGHLPSLASLIKPAADKAKAESPNAEATIPMAIQQNVWQQIESLLSRSSLIREFAKAGKVQIYGAVYDIGTGRVDWLGQHPQYDSLVAIPTPLEAEPEHETAPAAAVPIPAPVVPDQHEIDLSHDPAPLAPRTVAPPTAATAKKPVAPAKKSAAPVPPPESDETPTLARGSRDH